MSNMQFPGRPERRSCDGCTLCCEINQVKEIKKPANTECQFQAKGKGCTILGKEWRPLPCWQFECEYTIGAIPEELHPKKCGVYFINDVNHNVIYAFSRGGAWQRGKVADFIAYLAQKVIVVMKDGDANGIFYNGNNPQLHRKVHLMLVKLGVFTEFNKDDYR